MLSGGTERTRTLPSRTLTCGRRYHSTVDSLSNPQIFVLAEGVAVYPAYVISFKARSVDVD